MHNHSAGSFAVNVAKKKKLAAEQKKQLEQEIAQMNESLNDCYNTFLTDNGMSAEKSDVTAFTKWLEKNHSEEMDDLFLVYQKNKKITAQDIYDPLEQLCMFCQIHTKEIKG